MRSCVCVCDILNLFPLIFEKIKRAAKYFMLCSYCMLYCMTSFLTTVAAVFLSSSLHSKEPPITVGVLEVCRGSRQFINCIFSIIERTSLNTLSHFRNSCLFYKSTEREHFQNAPRNHFMSNTIRSCSSFSSPPYSYYSCRVCTHFTLHAVCKFVFL